MRWCVLFLVACSGGNDTGEFPRTSETLFPTADVDMGSGAQLRIRAQLAEASGELLEHGGLTMEVNVRAIDDSGQTTAGLFTVSMEADSGQATLSETILPGNQSFSLDLLAPGSCEPGCSVDVDFTFLHVDGNNAQLALELRSNAEIDDPEIDILNTLEVVF